MIENILFPVDFSLSSASMATYVKRAAAMFRSWVTLVHVYDAASHNGFELYARPPQEIREEHWNILATYQTPAFDRDSIQPALDTATIEKGRQLFYSKYACQSCHIIDPRKYTGYIGPTLTQVGS
jgi:hypothetical protein